MKYTLEFKLEFVEKYKKGIHINLPPGVKGVTRIFVLLLN